MSFTPVKNASHCLPFGNSTVGPKWSQSPIKTCHCDLPSHQLAGNSNGHEFPERMGPPTATGEATLPWHSDPLHVFLRGQAGPWDQVA